MRLLMIHNELAYFGGAERTLISFVEGFVQQKGNELILAAPPESRQARLLEGAGRLVPVSSSDRFSLRGLCREAHELESALAGTKLDLVHGWAARNWELSALVGRRLKLPAIGTLHDHPRSGYIRGRRKLLMRWVANWGLRCVVCVSDAVRQACLAAGFRQGKLAVVRNGLKAENEPIRERRDEVRIAYMGHLQPTKGFAGFLEILDLMDRRTERPWSARIAGQALDAASKRWVDDLVKRYQGRSWWPRVEWAGWVDSPRSFLNEVDLLVFPSTAFDSLPTVLLEAAAAGVPSLAAEVGGAGEIVDHERTGWLFQPEDWAGAAGWLHRLLADDEALVSAGRAARNRFLAHFKVENMVANYSKLYSTVRPN